MDAELEPGLPPVNAIAPATFGRSAMLPPLEEVVVQLGTLRGRSVATGEATEGSA